MQQVEIKKEYVAPKIAELGNISTVTLCATGHSGFLSFKHNQPE